MLKGVLGPSGVDIKLTSNVTVGTPEYFRRLTNLVKNTDTEYVSTTFEYWSVSYCTHQLVPSAVLVLVLQYYILVCL